VVVLGLGVAVNDDVGVVVGVYVALGDVPNDIEAELVDDAELVDVDDEELVGDAVFVGVGVAVDDTVDVGVCVGEGVIGTTNTPKYEVEAAAVDSKEYPAPTVALAS